MDRRSPRDMAEEWREQWFSGQPPCRLAMGAVLQAVYLGKALATTMSVTCAAPCSLSVLAHSSSEAPVVITSSTKAIRWPERSALQ